MAGSLLIGNLTTILLIADLYLHSKPPLTYGMSPLCIKGAQYLRSHRNKLFLTLAVCVCLVYVLLCSFFPPSVPFPSPLF